jgi:hypothetical protein
MTSRQWLGVLLLGILPLLMSGCGMSANKQAAEATATQLYKSISEKDWDGALGLYAPEFFQKMTKEQWHDILVNLSKKLGDYKNRQLQNWNYRSYVGTDGNRQVTTLTFQVQYANGESTETLTFLGTGDPLKISGHQINSPQLLLPDK